MPGAATITQFQGQTPPWSLVSLDANFTAQNALLKDVGNYSTYIADAGGANAYSCTYGVTLTFSLATGVKVVFKASNANTGASTLNVNATGIKNILNVDGTALTANQIVAGGIYTVVYDGTQYQLLNPTQGIVNRNAVITGSLSLAGNLTWATDATYDIGASGANRPRDFFMSRNALVGGTLNTLGNVIIGTAGGSTLTMGTQTAVSTALIASVAPNGVEFGHTNTAGFRSTIGGESGSGRGYIAFNAEHGTNANTYRTRGTKGSVIRGDAAGGWFFTTIPTASADNQAGTDAMSLTTAGLATLSSALVVTGSSASAPSIRLSGDTSAGLFNPAGNAVGISGNGVEQVRILGTASASRYLTLTGSNGGNPSIGASTGSVAFGSNVVIESATPSLSVGSSNVSTGDAAIDVGASRTGSGFAFVDLVGDTTYTDYGLRLIRNNSGANTGSQLIHRGTGNLTIQCSEAGVIAFNTSALEMARFTAGAYFKASSSGSYNSGTGAFHELRADQNGSALPVLRVEAFGATATNQNGIQCYLAGDPNNTTNFGYQLIGNATERATLRANGGLANFSANNVNLCSLSVKKDFTPLAELPGMLDLMWQAHRELDWAQYRYKDQTHEEFNYGPSAERVHELFTKRGIPLTDAWQPQVERVSAGALTIGGLSYDYSVTRREENTDSPLGITGDFAYVTGAMVSYAQKRIERIEAALMKAKLL